MLQLANRPTGRWWFLTLLRWAFRPRNFMKNRMLAVGRALPTGRRAGYLLQCFVVFRPCRRPTCAAPDGPIAPHDPDYKISWIAKKTKDRD
jgi:hypothetical protein